MRKPTLNATHTAKMIVIGCPSLQVLQFTNLFWPAEDGKEKP
jgi:hypothetical protein